MKISDLSPEEQEKQRQRWRTRKQKSRANQKEQLQYADYLEEEPQEKVKVLPELPKPLPPDDTADVWGRCIVRPGGLLTPEAIAEKWQEHDGYAKRWVLKKLNIVEEA